MKRDQRFLKKDWVALKMIEALEIKENDLVIEIGGGYGIITKFLNTRAIIFEKDKKLYDYLINKFEEKIKEGKFLILNQDFLKFDLPQEKYKIIGNIPYSIAGKIIRKIFVPEKHPEIAVFTFPQELGEKILSKPKGSFLSYFIRILAEPKKIIFIDKKLFWPSPKVNSLVIKFIFNKNIDFDFYDFVKFLKLCFSSPQKNIKNNLKKELKIEDIENLINKDLLKKRAHQISLEDLKRIYFEFKKNSKF